jgi:hypothetical protein
MFFVSPKRIAIGIVLLLAFLQIVPVSRDNPPEPEPIAWNSARTQELASRACLDCHSHQTRWPWYSYVAPVSFAIQRNVVQGRESMNLSDLSTTSSRGREKLADEIEEVVKEGSMPEPMYLPLHPEAALTDVEKIELVDGLRASLTAP